MWSSRTHMKHIIPSSFVEAITSQVVAHANEIKKLANLLVQRDFLIQGDTKNISFT